MILGEELRRKYALTSLKAAKGCAPVAVLAINDALEIAAEIAHRGGSLVIARRIRSLKWTDNAAVSISTPGLSGSSAKQAEKTS